LEKSGEHEESEKIKKNKEYLCQGPGINAKMVAKVNSLQKGGQTSKCKTFT